MVYRSKSIIIYGIQLSQPLLASRIAAFWSSGCQLLSSLLGIGVYCLVLRSRGLLVLRSRGQVNYRCLILHVRALSNECQCRCHWHKSDRLIHGFRVRRLASSAST
jgi:hypothetical protein